MTEEKLSWRVVAGCIADIIAELLEKGFKPIEIIGIFKPLIDAFEKYCKAMDTVLKKMRLIEGFFSIYYKYRLEAFKGLKLVEGFIPDGFSRCPPLKSAFDFFKSIISRSKTLIDKTSYFTSQAKAPIFRLESDIKRITYLASTLKYLIRLIEASEKVAIKTATEWLLALPEEQRTAEQELKFRSRAMIMVIKGAIPLE